jgi:thiamine biosynthesis lipoprotein
MPDPRLPVPTTRRDFLSGVLPERSESGESWIRVHRRAMACRFDVILDSTDASGLPAAREALDEVDRLESLLSVCRPDSVVSEVNRTAGAAPVALDADLFDLLQSCSTLTRETAGAFDITSTPLSRCWGFLQREGRLPSEEAIDAARNRVGGHLVELDAAARTVRFGCDGLEINLGAIGKGFALDRVGAILRRRHVRHALLSAGRSSLLAVGGRHRGWLIDITSPRVEPGQRLAQIRLRDAAIGTSGAGEQFVVVDGRRYGHVIDPRTGWPAAGVLSASVVAWDAATADALSTAFLVGGTALADEYCGEHRDVLALMTLEGEAEPVVFGHHPGASIVRGRTAVAR